MGANVTNVHWRNYNSLHVKDYAECKCIIQDLYRQLDTISGYRCSLTRMIGDEVS